MALSPQQRIPTRSIKFVGQAAVLASKHGFKKGLTKAIGKVNPTLIVLDAAISVTTCIISFIELHKVKKQRDTLKKELKLLPKQLDNERKKLQLDVDRQLDDLRVRQEQYKLIQQGIDLILKEIPVAIEHLKQYKEDFPHQLTQIELKEKELFRNIQEFSKAMQIYQTLKMED